MFHHDTFIVVLLKLMGIYCGVLHMHICICICKMYKPNSWCPSHILYDTLNDMILLRCYLFLFIYGCFFFSFKLSGTHNSKSFIQNLIENGCIIIITIGDADESGYWNLACTHKTLTINCISNTKVIVFVNGKALYANK